MRVNWEDIAGATPKAAPGAIPAKVAEVVEESPVNIVDQADSFLNQALDMIRKIDSIVGVYLQLSGKGGEIIDQPPPGNQEEATAPPQVGAPPDQILELLDKLLEGEGDIPLSRFVEGIRNQEPWLIKYATGGNQ